MRNHWIDERTLDEDIAPRGRDTDSSVAAQYEDSVPPDPLSDEEYEPS